MGICLGHQVIGEAFGAKVIRAPLPVHGKTAKIIHDGQDLFAHLPQPLTAGRYHSLIARPEITGVRHWAGAELLSRHEIGCRIRAHFRLDEQAASIVAVTRADAPAAAATRPACLALAVEPLDRGRKTKIVYTLLYDQAPLGTAQAKIENREARTKRFSEALNTMKAMAEAP